MPVSIGTPPAAPSKIQILRGGYGSTTSTGTTTLGTASTTDDIGSGKLVFFGINDAAATGNAQIGIANGPTTAGLTSEDDEAMYLEIIKDPTTATQMTYFKFSQAAGQTTSQATGLILNAAEGIFITGKTTAGTGYYNFSLILIEV